MCVIATIACSSDDGDPLATVTDPPAVPATTSVPATTAPTTTAAPASLPATEPATTPAPDTTADDVKAQIQADLTAGYQGLRALQMQPTLDGIDAVIAAIALPGSEYFEQQASYVEELVRLGDVVTIGDPPVDSVTVEEVTVEGSQPYAAASVRICEASNLGRITPAVNSPIGEDITVTTPELIAFRYSIHVVRSDVGWVQDLLPPVNVDAAFLDPRHVASHDRFDGAGRR